MGYHRGVSADVEYETRLQANSACSGRQWTAEPVPAVGTLGAGLECFYTCMSTNSLGASVSLAVDKLHRH